jgi:hypothetical protein
MTVPAVHSSFGGVAHLSNLNFMSAIVLFLSITASLAMAGDDASGPIHYSTDLSRSFTTYAMSEQDNEWSSSLVERLKYGGSVVHFVRTSLPLQVDKKTVQGAVYQGVEKTDYFYVVNGDAMLKLGTTWAYSPGVGGFSMYAPKSRNFIVCLNLDGGVPFLSSSPVQKGKVTWNGHDWNRFEKSSPTAQAPD